MNTFVYSAAKFEFLYILLILKTMSVERGIFFMCIIIPQISEADRQKVASKPSR